MPGTSLNIEQRIDNAAGIITTLCFIKENNLHSQDLDELLESVLYPATKIFCDLVGDVQVNWSPELPEYLWNNPHKAGETLDMVSDPDYRDNYYDENGGPPPLL